MNKHRVLTLTFVVVGLMFVLNTIQPGVGQTEPNRKIDPNLQTAMASQDTIPIVILGSEQLMSPSNGGLDAFIEANAGANRLTLRTETIAQLKQISAAQQPFILDQLGTAEDVVSLWLVNAVAATVSPETIEHLASLDEVLYLYPASGVVAVQKVEQVEEVIEPSEDRSFTLEGKDIPWNLTDIGAERVWREREIFGEGVIVASIDSGANYLHSDLINNIWMNESEIANNSIDDDLNGYIDDIYGYDFLRMSPRVGAFDRNGQHGTLTSGIIVGDGSGGILTGIAPRARLIVIKGASNHTAYMLAFQYALEQGADVLTMSFSWPDLGQVRGLWRLALNHALAAGLVSVSGAGNFQQNAQHPVQLRTPEDIPSVIAVGGVDQDLDLASFSSTGPVEWASVDIYQDHPELIKPNVAAFPSGYPMLGFGSLIYDRFSTRRGNSFSGPHAAGVAALMLSAAPTLPAWRVKEIMEATATDIGEPGNDNLTGAGLIDAWAAVEAALSETSSE
jgi:subtilisin family serine protease